MRTLFLFEKLINHIAIVSQIGIVGIAKYHVCLAIQMHGL